MKKSIRILAVVGCLAILGCDRTAREREVSVEVERPLNVAIIVFDALRPDFVGAFQSAETTSETNTPNIDRFIRQGIVFTNARTMTPSSPGSHHALFTGKTGEPHAITIPGLLRNSSAHYYSMGVSANNNITPDVLPCLKDAFDVFYGAPFTSIDCADIAMYLIREHGYKLAGTNYHYMSTTARSGNILIERSLDQYARESGGRPFVLFVNYMDAHDPYFPHEGDTDVVREGSRFNGDLRRRKFVHPGGWVLPDGQLAISTFATLNGLDDSDIKRIRELYAGEVRHLDRYFGEFLETMKRRGLYENTLFVIVSDHGESLGEHGHLTHSGPPYEECMRIVMAIVPPKHLEIAPRRVDSAAMIDQIFPTVMGMLGVRLSHAVPARSLFGPNDSPLPTGDRGAHERRTTTTESDPGRATQIKDLRRRGLITAPEGDDDAIQRQLKGLASLGYIGE